MPKTNLFVKIHSKSIIARVAAFQLKEKSIAITIGRHIFLCGIDKENFLADKRWLCHELVHVEQFQQFGFLKFILLYLKESWKYGYYNNRFEVEARAGESDETLLKKYILK